MTPPRIEVLSLSDLDDVVSVLVEAFGDYPVMRYTLGDDPDYASRLPRLIRLFASGRALRGEPMLGLRGADGGLLGAALVTPPDSAPPPAAFLELREQTWTALGDEARRRYEALMKVWDDCACSGRHHHLNMLGVRTAVRGRGLARPLLQAVFGLVEGQPDSRGVDLTTELPTNLPLYEQFGFRVTATGQLGDALTTWTMFRPRSVAIDPGCHKA